jgi:hypothetical protein
VQNDTCPRCESMNLFMSRKRGWVERWVLALLHVLPLRCRDCKRRFYSFRRPSY